MDANANAARNDDEIEDDRLRLIFTCCHPAIDPQIQVALTLREVCGLSTEDIAAAFLISTTTMAQRIVRGKSKIRDAGIPFIVPSEPELPQRLTTVLTVIYLVYSEGYSASTGFTHLRTELSGEAIRLGRLLLELLAHPEIMGLVALMLLQESRRAARVSDTGDLILLEEQNRRLWNPQLITEGLQLVEQSLRYGPPGPYTIQAAIAAVHAQSSAAAETDWLQIVQLYDVLLQQTQSPVVELNRAVAIAMCHGPADGLRVIDQLLQRGHLAEYHLAHAARADLLRRLERRAEAAAAYRQALKLTRQEPEIRFLQRRLQEMTDRLDG